MNLGLVPSTARRAFETTWAEITGIGRNPVTGGYERAALGPADLQMREWFAAEAAKRGLDVETDANGNQWAWWGRPHHAAVATGSHLDSVHGGGGYDGPLGVVSSLLAVDELRAAGFQPRRSLAIINFFEEEGSRFGRACLGSRLMTGSATPDKALGLADRDGTTLADAFRVAGIDPRTAGADPEAISRIGVFLELHIEQGRYLIDTDYSIGIARSIWPHGRWHFEFAGEGNHAGTTALADRRDPTLPLSQTVLLSRDLAASEHSVATFGRFQIEPNSTNAIPSRADAWLDARGPEQAAVERLLTGLEAGASDAAARHSVVLNLTRESWTDAVAFDPELGSTLRRALAAENIDAPYMDTAAGHDAGILADHVPTSMLFVRNPTGISHSPDEFAEIDDCVQGVRALTIALRSLLSEPKETSVT